MLKPQIPVCNNAYQFVLPVNHRNSANFVLLHQGKCISHVCIGPYRDGIVDHPVFSPFYRFHLLGLLLNAHVLVNNSDAPLTGHGNRQCGFGYRIHRRGNNWCVEFYIPCKLTGDIHFFWQYFRITGNQKYIIKRQCFKDDFIGELCHDCIYKWCEITKKEVILV